MKFISSEQIRREVIEDNDQYQVIEVTEIIKKQYFIDKWARFKYVRSGLMIPLEQPYKIIK